jgi:hypothetical protein
VRRPANIRRKQVGKIIRALRTFGFVYPVLVDEKGRVIAGWSLVLAAREMGLSDSASHPHRALGRPSADAPARAELRGSKSFFENA